MKLGLDLCGLSVCLGGGYNFMPAGSTVVVHMEKKTLQDGVSRILNATV